MKGNIEVGKGARLDLYCATTVKGNVQGDEDSSFYVPAHTPGGCDPTVSIRGDVQQDKGRGALLVKAVVGGNVQLKNNDPTGTTVAASEIAGDLQMFDNKGIRIIDNTIGGNCQAEGNIVIKVSGNTVGGNAEGQCKP